MGSLIEDLKYSHCSLISSRYYSCDPAGGRDGHSLKCKPHSYMFMHMYMPVLKLMIMKFALGLK